MFASSSVRHLPRLWYPLAALVLVLGLTSVAGAQTWNEGGDAGELVSTAQITVGTGPLTTINGNLAVPTDVDLYCVKLTEVPQAGLPLVSLQCAAIQGPNVWLFDAAGTGVFSNSTCSGGNKRILAPNVSLPVGTYYIGVSYSGLDPQSSGGAMWTSVPPSQRAPDGPGATGSLASWAGSPLVQPINPYQMNLLNMTFCDIATPARPATWSSLKVRYEN